MEKKNTRKKNAVIFEATKYSYQQSISDLNGVDTKEHNNDINTLIAKTRDWLSSASKRKTLPGAKIIIDSFNNFEFQFPLLVERLGYQADNIQFNDLCAIIQDWLEFELKKPKIV